MQEYLFKAILLGSVMFMFGCNNSNLNRQGNVRYDFLVEYNHQGSSRIEEDKYRFKFSDEKLYIFFESNFFDDKIDLEIDEKLSYSGTISTEESSGISKEIVVDNLCDIKTLSLRINNGSKIYFEILDIKHNLIGIRKTEELVKVVFYKQIPIFD